MPHQPDDQSPSGRSTSVQYGMLEVQNFAFLVLESESDFGVFPGLGIDLAGTDRKFLELGWTLPNCQSGEADQEYEDEESWQLKHVERLQVVLAMMQGHDCILSKLS